MKINKVNDAYAIEYETAPTRWLDLIGDGIAWKSAPGVTPTNDFTVTVISDGAGTSTFVNAVTSGKYGLITNAAGDYDGVSAQLKGENFSLVSTNKVFIRSDFTVSEAIQNDFAFGLIETDTTIFAVDTAHALAVTGSGIFFYSLDASDDLFMCVYDGGAQVSSVKVADMTTAEIELSFYWDGTTLSAMVDGVVEATITEGIPDEALTLTIDYHNGEDVANTCIVGRTVAFQA